MRHFTDRNIAKGNTSSNKQIIDTLSETIK